MSEHCGWCSRVVPLACKSADHANACDRYAWNGVTRAARLERLALLEKAATDHDAAYHALAERVSKLEADAERFRVIEARINVWIQACAEAGALQNYEGSNESNDA